MAAFISLVVILAGYALGHRICMKDFSKMQILDAGDTEEARFSWGRGDIDRKEVLVRFGGCSLFVGRW